MKQIGPTGQIFVRHNSSTCSTKMEEGFWRLFSYLSPKFEKRGLFLVLENADEPLQYVAVCLDRVRAAKNDLE